MSAAGGLGWGLGAALGAKLAAPDKLIVATVGDGAYMFANPTVCHWVGDKFDLPVLTVIFNNSRYGAVRRATLSMFKDGAAGEDDGQFLADLSPSPPFEEFVRSQGGHGERVEKPEELAGALARARDAVHARAQTGARQRDLPGLSGWTRALEHVKVALRAGIVLAVVAYILDIHGRLGIGLFTEQMLVTVLGLSLALTFLTFPLGCGRDRRGGGRQGGAAKSSRRRPGWIDITLAIVSLAACFYVAIRYPELIKELAYRPWYGVLVATVIVAVVFEASRRLTGWALIIIVLLLCAHALLGRYLPETFASRPVDISRLMVYLGIDTNALLGNTLQIAIVVVVPFIIMGQVLTRCGGSDFFADLAASLMGHFRGGAAKIAVVGSAFFGMISGSAVANVASVGTITIPLMKRAGFPAAHRGRRSRRSARPAGRSHRP